jgi:hypothetical protein
VSTQAASITFTDVASPGELTLQPVDASALPLQLPGQFAIESGLAYEVGTTASTAGPITLCFNVSHVIDPDLFAALRVLHGEGGIWVDRTTSRDYSSGTICAITDTLSPFVVGRLDVRYNIRKLYDETRAVRAGATVPLKLQLVGTQGENLSSADVAVTALALTKVSAAATATIQDAGNANPDSAFRFNASLQGGGYMFNLKTIGQTTGTYELTFKATGDPTRHTITYQVR